MVHFNARFIPNLASTVKPLRSLTPKDTQFVWGETEQQAFNKLKMDLVDAQTLGYFHRTAPTQVIADAGPVGLGAVLVRKQKGENGVISYASQGLTEVESRHSHSEKEALTLV